LLKAHEKEQPTSFAALPRAEQRNVLAAKLKTFQEDVDPVLEHYSTFGKLRFVTSSIV
jgi:hypothetical protein